MSDLIVVGFDDEFKADEARLELERMRKAQLVDLDDAVVAVRNQEGKVKLKQGYNLTASGAAGGSLWGLLIGLLFLNPLLGVVVGAASGGLAGYLTDIGIDDGFIKEVGNTLTPGTSALFVLVRKSTPDKVLPELRRFDGKVLRTSLSKEDEARLQAALKDEAHAQAV